MNEPTTNTFANSSTMTLIRLIAEQQQDDLFGDIAQNEFDEALPDDLQIAA